MELQWTSVGESDLHGKQIGTEADTFIHKVLDDVFMGFEACDVAVGISAFLLP